MLAPITHVLGARPNFVKAAPVIRALAALGNRQRVVHTGQHYDERLSDVFFVQLGLPEPDVNLGVGSGSHAQQTAAAMTGVEQDFTEHPPGLVVVYGDVNSTVAAGLVAAKLHTPMAHGEAGLRGFDETMPEEINRRVTDQLSALLFATSPEAIGYLANEGRPVDSIHLGGTPLMGPLVAHPGRAVLEGAGLSAHRGIPAVPPLGYLEFMGLVRGAAAVATDSGGVQEETTLLRVPCLTVRPNTARPITITHGSNRLITSAELASAVLKACDDGPYTGELPPLWDGHAGPRIGRIITDWLARDG